MDHLALRRQAHQRVEHRQQPVHPPLHQFPLRRGRQRDAHPVLQSLNPVEGDSRPVAQHRHHRVCALVVLLGADARGRARCEYLAASVAAQPVALPHRRLERRHPLHPQQHRRLFHRVHLARPAVPVRADRGQLKAVVPD